MGKMAQCAYCGAQQQLSDDPQEAMAFNNAHAHSGMRRDVTAGSGLGGEPKTSEANVANHTDSSNTGVTDYETNPEADANEIDGPDEVDESIYPQKKPYQM